MNPKDGKAGTAVVPIEPMDAQPADLADPGEMAEVKAKEIQNQSGKYGSTALKADKPPQTEEEKQSKKGWIEIELVDQENRPVPGKAYRIILPDGESAREGTLDEKGFARVEGIESGTCKITFPDLNDWKPV